MNKTKLFLVLMLSSVIFNLGYGQEKKEDSTKQDSTSIANKAGKQKVRIDLDFPLLISGTASVSYNFYKQNYFGFRVGIGGCFAYPIKNFNNYSIPFYWELAKLDIYHKIVLNRHFEFDTGLRGSVLLYPTEENGGGSARIGLYSQPMIGWTHIKFGTLVFISLRKDLTPIYIYPFCSRISITI